MFVRTLATLSLATLSLAQSNIPPAIPYARTQDLLVVDSSFDGIWRLCDFNLDGDYDDAGEISVFYSDLVGAYAWTTPTAIVSAPDGTVLVTEISNDAVYALRDLTGDGDANDPGEITIYFDGTNASGFPIPQAYGITVDATGRFYLAVNNATTPAGPDRILRLQDLNGDGDAQDASEAIDYYNFPGTTGSLATSIPTKVVVGPDGNLYYTEVGTGFTKGVWRLVDGNQNGTCNDPGEATLFWAPPFTTSPQYWSLCVDGAAGFVVSDHATSNEKIWRAFDANANGVIEAGEQTLFFQTTGSSWWDLVLRSDGTVLAVDSDSPDKIHALRDANADGDALDAGEATFAYHAATASTVVAVRGATMQRAPLLELTPPTVPIGTSTTVVTHAAKPLDLCVVVISIGLGVPLPLAPWGVVEIDIGGFVSIGAGFAGTNGDYPVPFAVPNDPAVIGSYAFQSLCGDQFRLFLGNAALMTVTP